MKVQLFGSVSNTLRPRSKKLLIFNVVALTILFSLPACAAGGGWRRVSASPNTVSFGSQTVGTTSSAQTITVKNTSARNLTVQSLTVNNSAFVLSGWQGATTLAPSSSLIVGVAFRRNWSQFSARSYGLCHRFTDPGSSSSRKDATVHVLGERQ
jgi:hypothetical protein